MGIKIIAENCPKCRYHRFEGRFVNETDIKYQCFNKQCNYVMINDAHDREVDIKVEYYVHQTWVKRILNPVLRKLGFVIVSKIDCNTNTFVGYQIRRFYNGNII